MPEPLVTLTAAADGTSFTLPAAAFVTLERAADGTAYPARPFALDELPATAEEAQALAEFIEDGVGAAWGADARLDVSAPFAACVLADPEAFVGPAVAALAWWLRRCGGFGVEAVPVGRRVPEPSVN